MNKFQLVLLTGTIFTIFSCTNKNTYQPEYADSWNKVELYINKNWHTARTDSSSAPWLRKVGIIAPKPFLSAAKGNPILWYWDHYFSNKGLLLIDSLSIYAQNAVDNLLWEVDSLGFAPNANMNWGMNRSQTPFLALMVFDIYEKSKDKNWLKKCYSTLKKEYLFWTDTSIHAIENHNTTVPGLQRFYNHATEAELIQLYSDTYGRKLLKNHPDSISLPKKLEIASYYASEAETGMDFTPRFENRCSDFIAIDLNSNLYQYEILFDYFVSELKLSSEPNWKLLAENRKTLINKYCWNENRGMFMDYDYKNKKFTTVASIACMYPMFVGLASKEQAEKTIKNLPLFEYKYGVTVCEKTEKPISYQWDYPVGWAPLYLLTVQALDNYGYKQDAMRICCKYLDIATKNFIAPNPKTYIEKDKVITRTPGAIYEKYNAVNGTIYDNEYTAWELFDWSTGVFIWSLDYSKKNK